MQIGEGRECSVLLHAYRLLNITKMDNFSKYKND